jgi:hypothetical protein
VIAVALCRKQTPGLAWPGLHRQPCPKHKILHANGHPHGKRAAQPSPAQPTHSPHKQQRGKSSWQSSPPLSSPLLASPHLGAVAEVECGFASNAEILSVLLSWRNRATVLCSLCRPCSTPPPPCQPTHQGASLFCSKCVLPLHRTHAIHLCVPFLPSFLSAFLSSFIFLPSSFFLKPLQVRAEFIRTPPPFNW